MLRNLFLALTLIVVVTSLSYATNKYTGLSESTLNVYVANGLDAFYEPRDLIRKYDAFGNLLVQFPASGFDITSGAVIGADCYHGMSVTPDEQWILAGDGQFTAGLLWPWYKSWGLDATPGALNSRSSFPMYQRGAGVAGFNAYNDGYNPGNNVFLIHPWAVANDWDTGNTAYIMGRGYWDGAVNIWRTDTNGAYTGGTAYVVAVAQFTGIHANPLGYITVEGQYIYGTCGYIDPGGVYRIDKNFQDQSIISWFIDSNDSKYANDNFSGTTDWRGLAFDQQGNLYVEYSKSGSWAIAKFDSSGNVINDELITFYGTVYDGWDSTGGQMGDLKCAADRLFVAGSNGVMVFDLNGNYLRQFGSSTAQTGGMRTIDVMGPVSSGNVDFVCTVTLVDWNGASLPTVTVTVDGGTPVVKTLTGSGSSGSFTLSLTPVSHDIKVKAVK
ncbi:MAG: hypothetical protein WCO51_10975, partial [bacterium]